MNFQRIFLYMFFCYAVFLNFTGAKEDLIISAHHVAKGSNNMENSRESRSVVFPKDLNSFLNEVTDSIIPDEQLEPLIPDLNFSGHLYE